MEDHEQERLTRRQKSLEEYQRIISYRITPPPPSDNSRDRHRHRRQLRFFLSAMLIILTAACYFFIGSRLTNADESNKKLQQELSSYQTRLDALEEKTSDGEETSESASQPSGTPAAVSSAQEVTDSFTVLYPLASGCIILHPFGSYTTDDGQEGFCTGLDLGTEEGSVVLAAADGVVLTSDNEEDTGKTIQIDHGNGYVTIYCYNKELLVSAGQTVTTGDEIALSGTAASDGIARMEFRVLRDGVCIDPETVMEING